MRIVSKQEFLALPAGTVFSPYRPCIFDGLCIKGSTLDGVDDFYYVSLSQCPIDADNSGELADMLDAAERDGVDIPTDFETEMREGMFDPDLLYAVWSKADLDAMIARLQMARTALDKHPESGVEKE